MMDSENLPKGASMPNAAFTSQTGPAPKLAPPPSNAPSLTTMPLHAAKRPSRTTPDFLREPPTVQVLRTTWRLSAGALVVYMAATAWLGFAGAAALGHSGVLHLEQAKGLFAALAAHVGMFLVVAVLLLMWVARAAKYLRRLGSITPAGNAAAAVGSFLTPVVWWWKPCVVMGTLWRGAVNPTDWESVPASQWITLWWVAWIGQNVVLVLALLVEWAMMRPDLLHADAAALYGYVGCAEVAALALLIVLGKTTARLGDHRAPRR